MAMITAEKKNGRKELDLLFLLMKYKRCWLTNFKSTMLQLPLENLYKETLLVVPVLLVVVWAWARFWPLVLREMRIIFLFLPSKKAHIHYIEHT